MLELLLRRRGLLQSIKRLLQLLDLSVVNVLKLLVHQEEHVNLYLEELGII